MPKLSTYCKEYVSLSTRSNIVAIMCVPKTWGHPVCGIRKILLYTYAELVIMQFSTWLWDLMDFRWMEYWWRKFSKMCLSSRRLNVSPRYANRILWKSHPFRCVGVKCWYRHCALHDMMVPPLLCIVPKPTKFWSINCQIHCVINQYFP